MYPQVLPAEVVDSVMFVMQRIISAPITWFSRLIGASGLQSYWLTCLYIFLVARFFLVPLFGKAIGTSLDDLIGSDKARKNLPNNDIDNDPYGGHI